MSETSARASRRPFMFGSLFRNGLIARRPPAGVTPAAGVPRPTTFCPNAGVLLAAGVALALAAGADGGNGAAAEEAGAPAGRTGGMPAAMVGRVCGYCADSEGPRGPSATASWAPAAGVCGRSGCAGCAGGVGGVIVAVGPAAPMGGAGRGGTPGRPAVRTGVGIAGRGGSPAGLTGGRLGGVTGGRAAGGCASTGRACVPRGAGGSTGRSAPGTGGVSFGIDARGDGGAVTGAAGGATGAIGIGGVTDSETTGVFSSGTGAAGAAGVAGADGTALIGMIGVPLEGRTRGAGGFVAEAASPVIAVISRDAREMTPGVKVGVGFRDDGIDELSGVGYGIAARPADGVTLGALAGASLDAAGAKTFGLETTGVGMRGAGGGTTGAGGVTRRVRAGVIVSGAASASDSMATRSCRSIVSRDAAEPPSMPMRTTAPQTEQRARTPPGGTFDGSTRKVDWHSAHETFTAPPLPGRA